MDNYETFTSVPPFIFEEKYYFLPSQVGELLPDPHLFLKFLLFWGGFGLS